MLLIGGKHVSLLKRFQMVFLKTLNMKTNVTQLEILLITGTTLALSQGVEKEAEKDNNFTEGEKLEDACWNGLLLEILPEIQTMFANDQKLFIWQIKGGKAFIELELAETPEKTDDHKS